MAQITAAQVKALREETGLPMMECKTALTEANGSTDEAKSLLQKKYKGKMSKRAANVTGEGRVAFYISEDRNRGALLDLRCETAPVAKTDRFIELAETIAETVGKQDAPAPSSEQVLALPSARRPDKTIAVEIEDAFAVLRENFKIEQCRKMNGGYVCAYVHHDGKSGVLIALDAVPDPESVGTDLCHHVVFSNPMAVTRETIPNEEIEKVRNLAKEVAEGEGKPSHIVEKIAEGKVNAFCAENALMEQEHVKVPKTKVGDVLKHAGVSAINDVMVFKIG